MIMRWMAEITYRNGRKPLLEQFEELHQLHDIVEHGPDWNEIEQIIVTLNRSVRLAHRDHRGGRRVGDRGPEWSGAGGCHQARDDLPVLRRWLLLARVPRTLEVPSVLQLQIPNTLTSTSDGRAAIDAAPSGAR
jgi:hypothetical protein